MAKVVFSDIEQFLGELELSKEHIDDNIVRVSRMDKADKDFKFRHIVMLVAGALAKGRLVELQLLVGRFETGRTRDEEIIKKQIVQLTENVETFCDKHSLQLRKGMFVADGFMF